MISNSSSNDEDHVTENNIVSATEQVIYEEEGHLEEVISLGEIPTITRVDLFQQVFGDSFNVNDSFPVSDDNDCGSEFNELNKDSMKEEINANNKEELEEVLCVSAGIV